VIVIDQKLIICLVRHFNSPDWLFTSFIPVRAVLIGVVETVRAHYRLRPKLLQWTGNPLPLEWTSPGNRYSIKGLRETVLAFTEIDSVRC